MFHKTRYRVFNCAGLPGLQPHLVPGQGLQLVQREGEGELEGAGAPGKSKVVRLLVTSSIVCSTFVSPLSLYCIPQYHSTFGQHIKYIQDRTFNAMTLPLYQ